MQKIKCPYCGQTLMYARIADIEIKCQRCKKIIEIKLKEQSEPHVK